MKPAGRTLDDLDDTDIAIIHLLQEDGRMATARMARSLGISEPTVRKRVERMEQEEIIQVAAVLNPLKTGSGTDALIGVKTTPNRIFEVGDRLARYERVVYLAYTTGRYDLLVEVLFHDDTELFEFIRFELGTIDGVIDTETSHVMRAARSDWTWKLPANHVSSVLAGQTGFPLLSQPIVASDGPASS